MSEWKCLKIGDLVNPKKHSCVGGPFGSNLVSEDYIDAPGIPVIRGNNFVLGSQYFHDEGFVFVSEEKADSLFQNTAYPGDLVFTQRGTIGNVALIPKDSKFPKYILSQNLMKLSVNSEKADPRFICYYFLSPKVQQTITRNSVGSTIPGFNLTQLRDFPVSLPDLKEQTEIADILFGLDRKIENLRRQNETLERIAQTLFKHWFVDFEFPNEDGKPYKSSGGAMERSELGEIPVGWRVGKLGDFGKVITGKTPSTKNSSYWGKGLPFVTPTDFKNYRKFVLNSEREISKLSVSEFENLIIPGNSVVVTCIGSDMGKVARTTTRCITNQQLNSLVFNQITNGVEYAYHFLVNQYKMLRLIALGGSTMPIVNKTAFSNIEILIPSSWILDKFNETVEPFNSKGIINEEQIQTLTKTRDILLPILMSGKLRIGFYKSKTLD